MNVRLTLVLAAGWFAACGAGPRQPTRTEPAPDLRAFPHDSALFALLIAPPAASQVDSLRQLEERTGLALPDTLAEIVEETSLHPRLRANAMSILGKLRATRHLILIQPLLADPDERVRLAAVGAAREFLAVRPESAMTLLGIALRDSSLAVQASVLESITDRDVALLRAWMGRRASPELVPVVQDLIRVAEERGAPLEADTATGVRARPGPNGGTLRFLPLQQWPQWQMAVGRLELRTARGDVVPLGDRVEVVRNVVPAFFSRDGEFLVYEDGREIFVHSLAAGTRRAVGKGIAPRPVPFTDDFVYARELPDARSEERSGARLQYELVRDSFVENAATNDAGVIGLIGANVSFDVAGGASPVRWMRVREKADGSGFELAGPGIDAAPLPGPFTAKLP